MEFKQFESFFFFLPNLPEKKSKQKGIPEWAQASLDPLFLCIVSIYLKKDWREERAGYPPF